MKSRFFIWQRAHCQSLAANVLLVVVSRKKTPISFVTFRVKIGIKLFPTSLRHFVLRQFERHQASVAVCVFGDMPSGRLAPPLPCSMDIYCRYLCLEGEGARTVPVECLPVYFKGIAVFRFMSKTFVYLLRDCAAISQAILLAVAGALPRCLTLAVLVPQASDALHCIPLRPPNYLTYCCAVP